MPTLSDTGNSRADVVPNWFLGGEKRRLLLEALRTRPVRGWTVPELVESTGCGPATAYEVVRVLRDIGLVEALGTGSRYRVAPEHRLAGPLGDLLKALRIYAKHEVDRPQRPPRDGG